MSQSPEPPPDTHTRDHYRPVANPDRVSSFKHSLAGVWYLVRNEQSVPILSLYTLGIVVLALWLQVDRFQFVMLLIPAGMIWVVECLNTAVEAAVDLAMPRIHPLAKVAKDLGSASTFLSALLSVIVSFILLAPPLFEKLSG